MGHSRTFTDADLAHHDPSFEVVEVPGAPETLRVGSIETGPRLVKIIGFPPSDLIVRAAARLKLSELPSQSRWTGTIRTPKEWPASKGRVHNGRTGK